jgi:hypothetical protein
MPGENVRIVDHGMWPATFTSGNGMLLAEGKNQRAHAGVSLSCFGVP